MWVGLFWVVSISMVKGVIFNLYKKVLFGFLTLFYMVDAFFYEIAIIMRADVGISEIVNSDI